MCLANFRMYKFFAFVCSCLYKHDLSFVPISHPTKFCISKHQQYNLCLTLAMLCWSSRRACTSCPWPIDMARQSSFNFLANISMLLVGSDPIDSKQISGMTGSLSSYVFSRSRITPSAYFSPIDSCTNLRACASVRSGHQHLWVNHAPWGGCLQWVLVTHTHTHTWSAAACGTNPVMFGIHQVSVPPQVLLYQTMPSNFAHF